ncbi:TlpA family protein disulfide reductase [Pedobacter duraquae]|uniref:Thioredoxin-like protein n=1 Tax=Pedobacter duraquae TaxID=425511 RepID=A0A4R6ICL3_9SPHI|nr:thioredoxin family protein [Pedobacter duraquae]TDO19376.1 thioredoxin-like protein [Pedobacter duraquae]
MKDNNIKNRCYFKVLICYIACTCLFINITANAQSKRNVDAKISFKIYLDKATQEDTLTMVVGDNMLSHLAAGGRTIGKRSFKRTLNNNGYFLFQIPVNSSHGYFQLIKNRRLGENSNSNIIYVNELQLWEAGDDLTVRMFFQEDQLGANSNATYSGIGSVKYNLANEFNHFNYHPNALDKTRSLEKFNGNILQYDAFDQLTPETVEKLKLLEQYRSKLTPLSYNVLKANEIYKSVSGYFTFILSYIRSEGFKSLNKETKETFNKRFVNSYDAMTNYGIDGRYLASSLAYINMLLGKLRIESALNTGSDSPEWIFNATTKFPTTAEIKELLIMRQLFKSRVFSDEFSSNFDSAMSIVKKPEYLQYLQELQVRMPGRQFSEFKLTDVNGNIRSNYEFKGKIVLIDFWFTNCGHCEALYKEVLSEVEEHFKNNPSVIFLSVSIDKHLAVWKESLSKQIYAPLDGINFFTNGSGENHPIIQSNNIPGYPCLILLDQQQKMVSFNSESLREKDSLIKAIANLH